MYYNANFLSNKNLKDLGFKKIGKNVLISKNSVIIGAKNITIEDNVRIDPFTFLLCPKGFIRIGKFSHIAPHVVIVGHKGVKLGKFLGLGSGVKIYSSSEDYSGEGLSNLNLSTQKINFKKFQKINEAVVDIGNHTNVGSNTVILPGCKVGKNSSIAANSIVQGKLLGGYIYAQNPLRAVLKKSKKNIIFEKKLKNKI